jgi:transposase
MRLTELFDDLPEAGSGKTRATGRARLREPSRDQVTMQVFDLDGLIDDTHPARLIWAYASQVDMSSFEALVKAREGTVGMARTSPHLLLALWLYATSDGVGSARALARNCETVAAYRWLCGGVGVNHRLLSEFRNDQAARIEGLLCAHVASLSAAGIIDLDEVAQDGVRVRASAGTSSFRRRKTLGQRLDQAKALLERLAKRNDDDEDGPSGRAQQAARERAQRVQRALEALDEAEKLQAKRERKHRDKEVRISMTDPDALVMKMADGGFRPAYNVQFASTPTSGIILSVWCAPGGSDGGMAEPMARRLEETYGRRPKRHLVDGGYQSAPCIEAAEAAGTAFYCPPKPSKDGGDPYQPRPKDTPAIIRWRARMASEAGQTVYRRRALAELIHAKLRNLHLDRLRVRGRAKVENWMRWFALVSNIFTAARLQAA